MAREDESAIFAFLDEIDNMIQTGVSESDQRQVKLVMREMHNTLSRLARDLADYAEMFDEMELGGLVGELSEELTSIASRVRGIIRQF